MWGHLGAGSWRGQSVRLRGKEADVLQREVGVEQAVGMLAVGHVKGMLAVSGFCFRRSATQLPQTLSGSSPCG